MTAIAIESHCIPMIKTKNSTDGVANFLDFLFVKQRYKVSKHVGIAKSKFHK